jgi:regulator of RNase E activity RraA
MHAVGRLDVLGMGGVISGLVPLWEGARLAGPAVTVKLAPGSPETGQSRVHLGARATSQSRSGSVIVVDNGGRTEMGAWGGLLSLAAARDGVAGVVLDGACRDVDEARELGFPVFGRCGVPRTARRRVFEESTGDPVSIGGVPVCQRASLSPTAAAWLSWIDPARSTSPRQPKGSAHVSTR